MNIFNYWRPRHARTHRAVRATSVEADQRLHRFRLFLRTRFEAEQPNSQTERDYHRNYHCTTKLFPVNCIAMARGWDFIIPPLRRKVKSLQLSSLRSSASIVPTIMGSPRYTVESTRDSRFA